MKMIPITQFIEIIKKQGAVGVLALWLAYTHFEVQDVTVLVGAEDGWGRSTWGSSTWNQSAPSSDLQLQTNVGTVAFSFPVVFDVSGAGAQVSIGTVEFSLDIVVPITTNLIQLQTGSAQASIPVTVEVGLIDGWGRAAWGSGAWNIGTIDPALTLSLQDAQVAVLGKAEVILSSNELGIQTGTLQFAGKATVNVTGEQVTLTIKAMNI